jgi:hypothetical protein
MYSIPGISASWAHLNQRIRERSANTIEVNAIKHMIDIVSKRIKNRVAPKGPWYARVSCFGYLVGDGLHISSYLTDRMSVEGKDFFSVSRNQKGLRFSS